MTKAIMVQGTASNAGKSLLAAGLCRIFTQDGYRVAPFKSQNMALNSFITKDGLEMGRAQVTQAEAAGCEPDVRMNPILLKPTSDRGSQVIVNGEVVGNMTAQEYYLRKRELMPKIEKAYASLASENDIIVLEGAGSPAEINLKENDIVNMYMAKRAKAPVLLTGDIDRGGVFASIYGTVMLLPEEERRLIRGIVINKFRGDVDILKPGIEMLEALVRKPVVGVVPYLHLDIDDEDSLSERLTESGPPKRIDVAVIRLPRISNFTDFNTFGRLKEASVRYAASVRELKEPDLIILPGTKNTMGDLKWLRACGLKAAILKHAAAGKPVIGICGGYQMLCKQLSDPFGVEEGGKMAGLGLLDAETVFEKQKTRMRIIGSFLKPEGLFAELNGAEFEGYEIHMGKTQGSAPALSAITSMQGEKKLDGMVSGNVFGSYVHGLFDSEDVLRGVVRALLKAQGIDAAQTEKAGWDIRTYKDQQYDLLAGALRSALDMDQVYQILEEGV
ncbi:MAG: cobyric acid synthase [Ethanoligenens sp.]